MNEDKTKTNNKNRVDEPDCKIIDGAIYDID